MKSSLYAKTISGLFSLAATAIVAGGCVTEDKSSTAESESDTIVTGECHGINSCKGQGACGGKGYSCAGKNACKGQGWHETSKKECNEKGGTFKNAKR